MAHRSADATVTEALHNAPSVSQKLLGCLLGGVNSPRDIPRLISLWQAGLLDLEGLVTARRPLTEINQALDDLRAGRGIRTVISL
jgi:Zn-dependent alcohol dehydrogenase